MLEENLPIDFFSLDFTLCLPSDFILRWHDPRLELEIFLEASGKIPLDILAASVADAAEKERARAVMNCHPLSIL
jgi:hypothetical protein